MKKTILFMTVLFVIAFSCMASASDNWQWVASNDRTTMFFNPNNIRYNLDSNGNIDKNVVDIELKMQFSAESLNEFIVARKIKDDTTNWNDLSYTLIKAKINKTDRIAMAYMSTYYDTSGNIIKKFDMNKNIKIKKNTMDDDLYNAVFAYVNNHDKELGKLK